MVPRNVNVLLDFVKQKKKKKKKKKGYNVKLVWVIGWVLLLFGKECSIYGYLYVWCLYVA